MAYFIGKRNIGKMTYELSKTMLSSLYGTFDMKEGDKMKCPFRIHFIERDNFMDGAKHHNEEFEECYKNDCPFYAKKEKREFCMRATMEVIENNVKNYTI